jgi:hypothetical protein
MARIHHYRAKRPCYWHHRLFKPDEDAVAINIDFEGVPPHHLYSTDGGPESEVPPTSRYARTPATKRGPGGARPIGLPLNDPRIPAQIVDDRGTLEVQPAVSGWEPDGTEVPPPVAPDPGEPMTGAPPDPQWVEPTGEDEEVEAPPKPKRGKKKASKKRGARRRTVEVRND